MCKHLIISKSISGFSRLACLSCECNFVFWNSPTPVIAAIIQTVKDVVLAKIVSKKTIFIQLLQVLLIQMNRLPTSAIKCECMKECSLLAYNINFWRISL